MGDNSEVGGSDHWERIKEFNRNFEYKESDDLRLWLTILDEQVEEIRTHLDEGREDKAVNEFIDCILVAQQPLLLDGYDVDRLLLERIEDIEGRIEDVQSKYRRKHAENCALSTTNTD